VAGKDDEQESWLGPGQAGSGGRFGPALQQLEAHVLDACGGQEAWPAQVAAGIYAGVDFVTENPELARDWVVDTTSNIDYRSQYEWVIGRMTELIRMRAPVDARLPASSDEALVAGIVGLVGDHVRIGRFERLAELRPELVQLTLLPYLGFVESRRWANQIAGRDAESA
jgi:hypothetical protein